jgi:glycosyltransferase involved in cell wall biosynthesis
MISIITSVHNQRGMNQLFYETLKRNTRNKFELIVVNNNSTDGSTEYFQQRAERQIVNAGNYSYPYCQNQGIAVASYDYLAFFNNDLLVSEGWDEKIIGIMRRQDIDVISFATNDHLETKAAQNKMHRRWKRVKHILRFFLGTGYRSLTWMAALMYGDFDKFCRQRFLEFGDQTIEGFSGSCILMTRSALEKVGLWDERHQAADFDLFYRTKVRSLEQKDIRPVQLALGVYFHHFQRLTLRSKHVAPFMDQHKMRPLEEKWGALAEALYKDVVG